MSENNDNSMTKITCPSCHYPHPNYDSDYGFYECPRCEAVWGLDSDDPDHEEEPLDLGTCCICGGLDKVHNIIMLDKKAHVPGTGWGCVVCHLPSDGATAIICDQCLANKSELEFTEIIYDYPAKKQRIAYKPELLEPFTHDHAKHAELEDQY